MLKHAKISGPWKTLVQVSLATSLHLGQRCSNMVRRCDVLDEFCDVFHDVIIPKNHFEILCWVWKDMLSFNKGQEHVMNCWFPGNDVS